MKLNNDKSINTQVENTTIQTASKSLITCCNQMYTIAILYLLYNNALIF